jgi:hypothetical protein
VETTAFSLNVYFEPRSDLQLQQLYWSWGVPRLADEAAARLRRLFRDRPRLLVHLMALDLLERIHDDNPAGEPIGEARLLRLLQTLDPVAG